MSKHLTLDNRTTIESKLDAGFSLGQIGKLLNRNVSVISREIRKHSVAVDVGAFGRIKNRCIHRNSCQKYGICEDKPNCTRLCASCKHCNSHCALYQEDTCCHLLESPYVCNGCTVKPTCVLRKKLYHATTAEQQYRDCLSDSRSGFNLHEAERLQIDQTVSPLVLQGQSIRHIAMTQPDILTVSERTLYRLVHDCALSCRAIDMPRVCRLRPRASKPVETKVDKACRIGRSYNDYLLYREDHRDLPVVEMDSVIGTPGGKVLLTLHLTSFDFMLAFLRDRNTSYSVTQIITWLRELLPHELFMEMFPILLADNGCEFSNPSTIEFQLHDRQTHVFYCKPSAPYQKPHVELNHEMIRRFIPKGKSMDALLQSDVSLMMSHINSYAREKYHGLSPTQLFVQAYGEKVLHLLRQDLIPADKIILNSSVFHL